MIVRFIKSEHPDSVDEKEKNRVFQLQEEWVESGLLVMDDHKDENSFNRLRDWDIFRDNTLVLLPDDKSDEIVGYLVFFRTAGSSGSLKSGHYEIYALFVSKRFRESGGGSLLMKKAEKHFSERMDRQRIKVCVMTSKKNECRLIKFRGFNSQVQQLV